MLSIVLIGISMYFSIKSSRAKDIERANLQLAQSIAEVDRELKDIEDISGHLSADPLLMQQVFTFPGDAGFSYNTLQLISQVQKYLQRNRIVRDCLIYFPQGDYVVTSQCANTLEAFYNYTFQAEGIALEDFRGRLCQPDQLWVPMYIQYNAASHYVFPWKDTFKFGGHEAIFLFLIDGQYINDLLTRATSLDSTFLVYTGEGRPIVDNEAMHELFYEKLLPKVSSCSNGYFLDGDNHLISFTTSYPNQWIFANVTDLRNVYLSRNLITMFCIIIFVVLGIGIIISVIYTKYHFLPTVHVLAKLNVGTRAVNPIQSIEESVENLLLSKKALQYECQNFRKSMAAITLHKLISGSYTKQAELTQVFSELGIPSDSKFFGLVLIDFSFVSDNMIENTAAVSGFFHQQISQACPSALSFNYENNKIVVLIRLDCISPEESSVLLGEFANNITKLFNETKEFQTKLFVSETYSDLLESAAQFELLRYSAFSRLAATDKTIIWCHPPQGQNAISYYYPSYIENNLFQAVVSGSQEQVHQLLTQLYKKNILDRELDAYTTRIFLIHLFGTLFQLCDYIADVPEIRQKVSETAVNVFHVSELELNKLIIDMFTELTAHQNQVLLKDDTSMVERIKYIVSEKYSDPNLSLTYIESELGLSYTYLSNLFRQKTGEKLSAYIEQYRMAQAHNWLKETEKTSQEIASLCGYQSSTSFGRAFKRIYGCTPTEYRSRIHNQK